MAKSSKPFQYRGRWRASLTLPNGTRPTKDFDSYEDALQFLAEQRVKQAGLGSPEMGGSTVTTLAQALAHYAKLVTVGKKGARAELNRINHYLQAAGLSQLRLIKGANGILNLAEYVPHVPKGLQAHLARRQAKGHMVAQVIKKLATARCSQLTPARFRELMTAMKASGLADSTIQKEMALLRHLFNVARTEWGWTTFVNPTAGLKLGKSEMRFVKVTQDQRTLLFSALKECRGHFIWPLVQIALETTLRLGSLIALKWSLTDLEGRVMIAPSKTGTVAVPLSLQAVKVLEKLQTQQGEIPTEDRIFPLSENAVRMAWKGAREKAGLPWLQFKDLRHLSATDYARQGLNPHELKVMLGHKSTRMAEVYVNLAAVDLLNKLDSCSREAPVMQKSVTLGNNVFPMRKSKAN